MKIKSVCELTGLSDRTIRYYVEEKLISPSYTENYLGRKSFDFSKADVDTLNDIAILRRFDFSVGEIRDIITDAENSKSIIQSVKDRTELRVNDGRVLLEALSRIPADKAYTLASLAEQLSKPSSDLPLQTENIKRSAKQTLISVIKSVLLFIAVWLPVAICGLIVGVTVNVYSYPVFYPKAIVFLILLVLPSAVMLVIGRIKKPWRQIARVITLAFCIISLLCGNFALTLPIGIMAKSETADITEYRDVDSDCLANKDVFYQKLFPAFPHYFENVKQEDGSFETVYLDSHYYYRYLTVMDYTYDIFAQWQLEESEFEKEVSRVRELFGQEGDYVTVKKGAYTCFFLYDGNSPFEAVTDSYTYYIFAFNEETLTVRYIYCVSLENGADQPYYLQLDWQQ